MEANEMLALATTEELIKEMYSRFESVLLVTVSAPENGDDPRKGGAVRTSYKGGISSGLGLAVLAKDQLLAWSRGEEMDNDEDDDE